MATDSTPVFDLSDNSVFDKPPAKSEKKPAEKKLFDKQPKKVGRPSKTSVQREIETELQSYITLISLGWSTVDDYCPIVLSQQSEAIASSLAAILIKNPKILEKFKAMTGMGEYFNLLAALTPVIAAIKSHHIQPAFEKVNDGGNPSDSLG